MVVVERTIYVRVSQGYGLGIEVKTSNICLSSIEVLR